jgi:uroporphyrinogen decarboxylase
MNGIERVRAAIQGRPLDRVPLGELVVEPQFMQAYLLDAAASVDADAGARPNTSLDLEMAFFRLAGLDLVCLASPGLPEQQPVPMVRAAEVRRFRKAGLFVFALINGAFQTLMLAQGFERFLKNIAQRPDEIVAALNRVSHALLSRIRAEVGAGVDGVIIGDDLAYNMGPYVSPIFIEKHLQPCWHQQVSCARDLKVPVFLHSDGNINALLPSIAAAGFDGLQCLESAAGMDMARIKAQYGDKLCLMGNIDAGLLSPDARPISDSPGSVPSPQALERAVAALMSIADPGGGFIFGTSCGLHPGLDPCKVRRMYTLARELGTFPQPA